MTFYWYYKWFTPLTKNFVSKKMIILVCSLCAFEVLPSTGYSQYSFWKKTTVKFPLWKNVWKASGNLHYLPHFPSQKRKQSNYKMKYLRTKENGSLFSASNFILLLKFWCRKTCVVCLMALFHPTRLTLRAK